MKETAEIKGKGKKDWDIPCPPNYPSTPIPTTITTNDKKKPTMKSNLLYGNWPVLSLEQSQPILIATLGRRCTCSHEDSEYAEDILSTVHIILCNHLEEVLTVEDIFSSFWLYISSLSTPFLIAARVTPQHIFPSAHHWFVFPSSPFQWILGFQIIFLCFPFCVSVCPSLF